MGVVIVGTVIGVICLIIAMPTYFMGCNKNVSTTCFAYNTFKGTVYKTEIDTNTCSRCIQHADASNKNKCTYTEYYTCYNAYVWARKGPSNSSSTCYYQIVHDYSSKQNAQNQVNDWNIGENVNWLQKKGTHECVNVGEAYTLWVVGIVFFSLMGAAFMVAICFGLLEMLAI
jgi:hypothetical protein